MINWLCWKEEIISGQYDMIIWIFIISRSTFWVSVPASSLGSYIIDEVQLWPIKILHSERKQVPSVWPKDPAWQKRGPDVFWHIQGLSSKNMPFVLGSLSFLPFCYSLQKNHTTDRYKASMKNIQNSIGDYSCKWIVRRYIDAQQAGTLLWAVEFQSQCALRVIALHKFKASFTPSAIKIQFLARWLSG